MLTPDEAALRDAILSRVPGDGSSIGNLALSRAVAEHLGTGFDGAAFEAARLALVADGTLFKGAGRGGSLRRAAPSAAPQDLADADGFELQIQIAPPQQAPAQTAPRPAARRAAAAPASAGAPQVISYRHADKRKNNPQVGLVNEASDPPQPKTTWAYDPHLDPALQFDVGRAGVEQLIDDALASGDEATMRAALECLRKQSAPYLAWTGKAERTSFEVDTVSLHVHERIDPASILAAVRNDMRKHLNDTKAGKAPPPAQMGLFSAPFEDVPLRDAIDFYKHERGWSNRLVAGDSLLVMNSLLQKEGMAGRVQMIYIDPPYGIKYGSNFQPFVGKRDVKDRSDADLTQEPEMIKAFRDTWELGIHSYLTYLRDRLLLARELLAETGSVFVQISDENLHHVREMMDDVFGAENLVGQIVIQKTGGFTKNTLPLIEDYVVWYAKDKSAVKYHGLRTHDPQPPSSDKYYRRLQLPSGAWRFLKSEESDSPELTSPQRIFRHGPLNSDGPASSPTQFTFNGIDFDCNSNRHWTVDAETDLPRIARSGHVFQIGNDVAFKLFWDFNPAKPLNNVWLDTQSGGFNDEKTYAVQTTTKVIERCLLMTTDPGDLVLDPTCGSGTTAFVAEKWGRRWITCDTSRVAVTLAKQRLMTASYDYYELAYPNEGLRGGFIYKTVPHVTLKSIANNADIDAIYERLHPAIETTLTVLNAVLNANPPAEAFAVSEGVRKGSRLAFSKKKPETLAEWEVPFDLPDAWPESLRPAFNAFHAARLTMQRAMDRSIADRAESETLYDQPRIAKDKLRISGPFTVEAVPYPSVLSLDEAQQPQEADVAIARSGESARQHGWRDELLKTGIRGKGGQLLRFTSLETVPGTACVHASGSLETGERVVVSFGPEHGALEQRQVEHAIREAGELFPLPKMIVFCAFAFDPEAAKDINAFKGITALKAQMNTDLLTEDLKKARSSNQSFWLMGQPDVDVRQRADGMYEVEVNGFDYFDTVKGELISGGKTRIAMWSLDTDYDDRSLFPRRCSSRWRARTRAG